MRGTSDHRAEPAHRCWQLRYLDGACMADEVDDRGHVGAGHARAEQMMGDGPACSPSWRPEVG